MGYNVVTTTSANCVFTTASPCTTYVTDHVSTYMGGAARLQSRLTQSTAASAAAGRWVYRYRIDMTQVAGITYPPSTSRLAIYNFGPVWNYDYNADFNFSDHVFNSTSGLGTKPVTASYLSGGWTYFDLSNPVYAGSYPGGGESSYFFGIVSSYPPVIRTMWVYTDTGWVSVTGYAPDYP
ncbi:MAG TPA: hypothetical protein VEU30_14045 [Thermoanaerobaculia bacterium]|nr:hypothetical protein [Thermoanaerobaculia bacterium]